MARIACAQMTSSDSIVENFQQVEDFVQRAVEQEALMLVLPEDCLTLGLSCQAKVKMSQDSAHWQEKFARLAKDFGIWLVVGSLPVQASATHYYSTSLVFNAQGDLVQTYQKIHLFDVSVAEGVSYQESNTVQAGHLPVVFESPIGKIGLSICYDVRFPELYRLLSAYGAQILLVPSAFTPQTGAVHWETLLKARAIENLCYVVAPNQNGQRHHGEGTYGHSLIISPWGDILASATQGSALLTADLCLDYLHQCRKQFPVLNHRIFSTIGEHAE